MANRKAVLHIPAAAGLIADITSAEKLPNISDYQSYPVFP